MDQFIIQREPLDALSVNNELLQSVVWARFKSGFGWQSLAFSSTQAGNKTHFLVMHRKIGLGQGLAYVPFGPPVAQPPDISAYINGLGRALRPFLPSDTVLLRFDLPWGNSGAANIPARLNGLLKSVSDIQPPSTVILDLSLDADQILSGMKNKTRYNIKLGAKKGVTYRQGGLERLNAWYDLYQETARRDKIAIHALGYYRALFEVRHPDWRIMLFLAEHEGELLAGIVVAVWKQSAWYLYGASSNNKRNLMPNHGLQWAGIMEAKKLGCHSYDLFGIPRADDPDDPMSGLYRFKTGFGGTILNRYGCYDLALRPFSYALYRRAEKLRLWYFKRYKKR